MVRSRCSSNPIGHPRNPEAPFDLPSEMLRWCYAHHPLVVRSRAGDERVMSGLSAGDERVSSVFSTRKAEARGVAKEGLPGENHAPSSRECRRIETGTPGAPYLHYAKASFENPLKYASRCRPAACPLRPAGRAGADSSGGITSVERRFKAAGPPSRDMGLALDQ